MRQLWRLMPSVRLLGQQGLPACQQNRSFSALCGIPKPAEATLLRKPVNDQIGLWFRPSFLSPFNQVVQQRTFASKVKKYKIKAYSSYKDRFKQKANGEIKRWRAGKRHNAHSKTNKQLRQLRRPAVVHSAYAKVMKKLNFLG